MSKLKAALESFKGLEFGTNGNGLHLSGITDAEDADMFVNSLAIKLGGVDWRTGCEAIGLSRLPIDPTPAYRIEYSEGGHPTMLAFYPSTSELYVERGVSFDVADYMVGGMDRVVNALSELEGGLGFRRLGGSFMGQEMYLIDGVSGCSESAEFVQRLAMLLGVRDHFDGDEVISLRKNELDEKPTFRMSGVVLGRTMLLAYCPEDRLLNVWLTTEKW